MDDYLKISRKNYLHSIFFEIFFVSFKFFLPLQFVKRSYSLTLTTKRLLLFLNCKTRKSPIFKHDNQNNKQKAEVYYTWALAYYYRVGVWRYLWKQLVRKSSRIFFYILSQKNNTKCFIVKSS